MSFTDFHVHTSPGLVPRHHSDAEIGGLLNAAGVASFVLKAHEGSTAERAILAGCGAVGSITLNSPVGGANPDAVMVAASLGSRVVWLPTVSAQAHQAARDDAALAVHRGLDFRCVPVCEDGRLLDQWHDVLDVVAEHDMVLASGHVTMDEALEVFRVARRRGVQRFLVNHPMMPFLGWRKDHVDALVELGAYVEVGVLADLLAPDAESPTVHLADNYPSSLIVFGSDLGHRDYPDVEPAMEEWLLAADTALGARLVDRITSKNGEELLIR